MCLDIKLSSYPQYQSPVSSSVFHLRNTRGVRLIYPNFSGVHIWNYLTQDTDIRTACESFVRNVLLMGGCTSHSWSSIEHEEHKNCPTKSFLRVGSVCDWGCTRVLAVTSADPYSGRTSYLEPTISYVKCKYCTVNFCTRSIRGVGRGPYSISRVSVNSGCFRVWRGWQAASRNDIPLIISSRTSTNILCLIFCDRQVQFWKIHRMIDNPRITLMWDKKTIYYKETVRREGQILGVFKCRTFW